MAHFGYCQSQILGRMGALTTSSASLSQTSSSSSVIANNSTSNSTSKCCENGRTILIDPFTGNSICSCQYDPQTHFLNYQRLGLQLYGSYSDQAFLAPFANDPAPFYSSTASSFELKDNLGAAAAAAAAASWPYSMYYPYEASLGGYPFSSYNVDLNNARRKNATRETTSTLKAWLNEHKKNPYPTKGEKIMLAIITKMTLTQVSTWFANARRRLKKENKMTWEPRNRVDDEGINEDENADDDDKDESKLILNNGAEESELLFGRESSIPSTESASPTHTLSPRNRPDSSVSISQEETNGHSKPRIWSIVDTATSNAPSFSGSKFCSSNKILPTFGGHLRVTPYSRPSPNDLSGCALPNEETLFGMYAKNFGTFPSFNKISPFSMLKPPVNILNGFLAHNSSGNASNIPNTKQSLRITEK